MNIEEIQSIMIDSYQVGYMEAVKAYEPAQDLIRLRDVKKWLRMMRIDWKRFNVLVNKELIKPIRKGESRNSPPLLFKNRNQTSLVAGECQRNNGERYNWINLLNIYDYE